MSRVSVLISLLALSGLLVGLVPGSLVAQEAAGPTEPVVVRLYFSGQAQLDAVAGELDIWEVHDGYVVAAVTPEQYRWLADLGYRLEIDAEKTEWLGIDAPLDPRFYYFDDNYTNPNGLYMVDFLQQTNTTYSDIVELIDIGDAWQAGHGGYHRDLWVLRISNEDPAFGDIADKPPFYLMANIHAREVTTPEMAIRYIKYLTSGYNGQGGYGIDPDVTWLVDWNVVYIEVSQNPDGHRVNEANTSAYWRKNLNDTECPGGDFGIDLNRNHSFFWGCCGGSSGDPCDETYRGPTRASEPETQAYQNYFAATFTDWNGPNGDDELPPAAPDDASGIMLTLHTYSDLVLWPWGHTASQAPNGAQLRTIGRKFAYYNNYTPQQAYQLYATDGTTDDWSYGKFGGASFTFEIGPGGGSCGGFFPAYECMEGEAGYPQNFWAENRPAFLFAHKIARTPYMTAYGPDAADLTVVPGVVPPGTPVQLQAAIADHRYPGDPLQPIAAAEYFVGVPGADGTGIAMAPADGSWGDLSEVVTATVDTSGLGLGRYYILVHGRNTNGDWGPFTAVFLYLLEPGASPVIEGYVHDASDNAPLEATITAGAFQAVSDPATGYYSMTVISGSYDVNALAAGYAISTVTGVEVHDYEVVRQDFYLYTFCEIFTDNVELGNLGWTADPPWAITDEASHSPIHSWTDSPGSSYTNSVNIALTSPTFDLSGHQEIGLSFWHIYDLQDGWDYGYVEVSTDGGLNWTEVTSYNGEGHLTWTEESVLLPGLDDQPDARVRFRLQTTPYVVADGWHIDDIVLTGGGPSCVSPLAPAAAFTWTTPAYPGEPVSFINLTQGTPPFDFWWDLGDGMTSTLDYPTHVYAVTGTYTVTLVATNTLGSDSVSHQVVVTGASCDPVHDAAFIWAPPTPVVSETVAFTGTAAGDEPITYTWSFGDGDSGAGANVSHAYGAAGDYTVVLTATNCGTATAVVTHTVTVEALPCDAVQILTTTAVITGCEVAFRAELSGTVPFVYLWAFGDGLTSTLAAPVHTYGATGVYTATLEVWNCAQAGYDTESVVVEVSCAARWSVYLPVVFKGHGSP